MRRQAQPRDRVSVAIPSPFLVAGSPPRVPAAAKDPRRVAEDPAQLRPLDGVAQELDVDIEVHDVRAADQRPRVLDREPRAAPRHEPSLAGARADAPNLRENAHHRVLRAQRSAGVTGGLRRQPPLDRHHPEEAAQGRRRGVRARHHLGERRVARFVDQKRQRVSRKQHVVVVAREHRDARRAAPRRRGAVHVSVRDALEIDMRGGVTAHVPNLAEVRVQRRQRAVRPERVRGDPRSVVPSRGVGRLCFVHAHDAPQRRALATPSLRVPLAKELESFARDVLARLSVGHAFRALEGPQEPIPQVQVVDERVPPQQERLGRLVDDPKPRHELRAWPVPIGSVRGLLDVSYGLGIVALAVPVLHLIARDGGFAEVKKVTRVPTKRKQRKSNNVPRISPRRASSSASSCFRERWLPQPRSGRRVMAGTFTTATPRYRGNITRIISGSSHGAHHAIRRVLPEPGSPNRRARKSSENRANQIDERAVEVIRRDSDFPHLATWLLRPPPPRHSSAARAPRQLQTGH